MDEDETAVTEPVMAETHSWSGMQAEQFVRAHVETAVDSLDAERRGVLDGLDAEGLLAAFAPATREVLDAQARRFLAAHGDTLARWLAPEHAGYCLWMNRTGEGEGFWSNYLATDPASRFSREALTVRRDPDVNREFDAAMHELTIAANELGEVHLSVGDDRLISM